MQVIDISIIIPVYNVEDFLQECIESIITQSFKNYEVIIVDNGSVDSTLEIAKRYQNEYDWLHVYEYPYGLVGGARNFGINKAKGTFLMFVDGDDLLPNNALELLIDVAYKNNVDIAMGNIVKYLPDKLKNFEDLKEIHRRDIVINSISEYNSLIKSQTPCNKLFRKSLIIENNLEFPINLVHEDLFFTTVAFLHANKIAVIKENVYYYRKFEQESITSHNNEFNYFYDRMTILNLLDEYIYNHNLTNLKPIVDFYKLEKFLMPIEWRMFSVYNEEQTQKMFYIMHEQLSKIPYDLIEQTKLNKLAYLLIKSGNFRAYKSFKFYGELNLDIISGRIHLDLADIKIYLPEYINKLPVRYKIDDVLISNQEFVLKGYAFLEGVTIKHPNLFITSLYIESNNGNCYFFNTAEVERAELVHIFQAPINSGFEARIDLTKIEALYDQTFSLYINIFYAGFQREELIHISEYKMIELSTKTDWNIIRRLTNVNKIYLDQISQKEGQFLIKNIDSNNNIIISSNLKRKDSRLKWVWRQITKLIRNPFTFARDFRKWANKRREK